MCGRRLLSGGCSWLVLGQDAVDGLDGVALLPSLAGHEPALVRLWSAELAWTCVVGVYPASVADDVSAVAVGLAAVCVEFCWSVHLVSPQVGPLAPAHPFGPSRASPGS